MIIALLCLIGLGFYMLVMNAGGMEEFKNRFEYKLYKLKGNSEGNDPLPRCGRPEISVCRKLFP